MNKKEISQNLNSTPVVITQLDHIAFSFLV